jgi:chromosome segregation ATPase
MEQYQRSATDANRVAGELRRVTEENKKLRLDLQERVAEILRLKESYQKVFESNVRATRRIGELEYNASRSVLRKAAREATSQLEAARKEIEILRGDKMQPGPPLQVNSAAPRYYGVDRILNYR